MNYAKFFAGDTGSDSKNQPSRPPPRLKSGEAPPSQKYSNFFESKAVNKHAQELNPTQTRFGYSHIGQGLEQQKESENAGFYMNERKQRNV